MKKRACGVSRSLGRSNVMSMANAITFYRSRLSHKSDTRSEGLFGISGFCYEFGKGSRFTDTISTLSPSFAARPVRQTRAILNTRNFDANAFVHCVLESPANLRDGERTTVDGDAPLVDDRRGSFSSAPPKTSCRGNFSVTNGKAQRSISSMLGVLITQKKGSDARQETATD